jgi:murein DD-endopeptidase MepM/ murein hydrolase activator NlpD
VALFLAACVAAVTLGTTLRSSGQSNGSGPIPPRNYLPSGPPQRQLLATQSGVRLFVPIEQDLITAIAYHPLQQSRAFSLEPAGQQLNAGFLHRMVRRFFGDDSGGLRYYVSDGSTDAVDVGARAGTAVYAPVDGQVVSLAPDVINGRTYGSTIGIQSTDNPAVVVRVSHVVLQHQRDGLTRVKVGQRVSAGDTQLGGVADIASVLTSDLRSYVSDSGNNAMIEVVPAPAPSIP